MRRFLVWCGAALLLSLGVYLALSGVRLNQVRADMVEARAQLLMAESILEEEGVSQSPERLEAASRVLVSAREKFRASESFLGGEPPLWVGRHLPWIGTQVSAACELARIGYEASEIGLLGVSILLSIDETPSGSPGKRAVAFLDSIEGKMAEMEARLADIAVRRKGLESRWIVSPLKAPGRDLGERMPRLERWVARYRSGHAVASDLLGVGRPARYLVLGLDNTELLPGGGLIGTYGVVTFDDGALVDRFFSEADEVTQRWQERSGGEYVAPPAPLKRYLLREWTWNFGVAGWSPDFPTSARQALSFYERSGAEAVDGVIALDFSALEGLLDLLGPQEIPGYGVAVDAATVTEETLTHVRQAPDPDQKPHAFAHAVAAQVIDAALRAESGDWASLLETLDRLAQEKHLFLYARDERLQAGVRDLGWSGELRDPPGDYVMLVNASVHSTKLNLVLEQSMRLHVSLDDGGGAHHDLTVRYENALQAWASTRDPVVVERLMGSGFYGGYLRLLSHSEARLLDVQIDGRTVGAEEVTVEAGKASFGRYLPLPAGAAADLRFIYEAPAVVRRSSGEYEYRLFVQKQAGAVEMPLAVSVRLPPGAEATAVSLDARPLAGAPLTVETDLARDRELVVRYRR